LREDLVAGVARRLELQPSLVRSSFPIPESRAKACSTSFFADNPEVATADGGGRDLLLRCVADPEMAARLPRGDALAQLFPDELQRRAGEHIRAHAHEPAAGLPDDDELVALITSLLTAPGTGD
jgi:hypothetical protein